MSIPAILFSLGGRIGRGGFWLTVLVSVVLSVAAMLIAGAMHGPMMVMLDAAGAPLAPGADPTQIGSVEWNWSYLMTYAALALPAMWVAFAGSVKRLHDRGRSGWWYLLMMVLSVVVVGFIWWLVDLGILEGQDGENKYGADPRGNTTATA